MLQNKFSIEISLRDYVGTSKVLKMWNWVIITPPKCSNCQFLLQRWFEISWCEVRSMNAYLERK